MNYFIPIHHGTNLHEDTLGTHHRILHMFREILSYSSLSHKVLHSVDTMIEIRMDLFIWENVRLGSLQASCFILSILLKYLKMLMSRTKFHALINSVLADSKSIQCGTISWMFSSPVGFWSSSIHRWVFVISTSHSGWIVLLHPFLCFCKFTLRPHI